MTSVRKAFGDLKVRPKLVLLHNTFFLVPTVSVYLSVIPVFEQKIASARQRELAMMGQIFAAELPIAGSRASDSFGDLYNYREGLAKDLGLSPEGQQFLAKTPGGTWQQGKDTLFRQGRAPGEYRRLSLSPSFYEEAVSRAKTLLFVVLGLIYLASILVRVHHHAAIRVPAVAPDAPCKFRHSSGGPAERDDRSEVDCRR